MNFYISNSNRFKIIFSFVIFLLLSFFFSLYLSNVFHSKGNKRFWKENKISKSLHFKKNNLKKFDYIFIGSSRTLYHISTNIFKKNKINIYNYGLSYLGLYDYPYIVNRAIESSPKSIVISLSIDDLFKKRYNFWELTIEDLDVIFKTQSDAIVYDSLVTYIQGIDYIPKHILPIRNEIINFYKRAFLISKTTQNKRKYDCEFLEKGMDVKSTIKCTNGDAILYSTIKQKSTKNYKVKVLEYQDDDTVKMLNYLINKIKEHNLRPIIIFEPIKDNFYSYNINNIKKMLDTTNIIDLTKYPIKNEYWGDKIHLNNRGRIFYSEYLSKYLLSF